MSLEQRPSMLARLRSLIQGIFGGWVRRRENRSPEVVYEQAIGERVRQYRELKSAVAGILYMRNKLETEINERRAEIARLHDDVRRAVRDGRDEISLSLIAQKQALFEDLERAEEELSSVKAQAEEAKANLVRFREEIRALVREKGRMRTAEQGPVVVTVMDRDRMGDYQSMVAELRGAGIRAEVYLGNPKNFGNQMKYADKRGSPIAIIEGGDEKARGVVQIKDLILGAKIAENATLEEWKERPSQIEVPRGDLVAEVRQMLGSQAE